MRNFFELQSAAEEKVIIAIDKIAAIIIPSRFAKVYTGQALIQVGQGIIQAPEKEAIRLAAYIRDCEKAEKKDEYEAENHKLQIIAPGPQESR